MSQAGNLPVELVYRVYIDPDQGSNILKQYIYKRQLQIIAGDQQNNTLQGIIQSAEYSEKDLQKIAVLINGKSENNSFTYENQSGTQFFVGAGLNISSVKSTGNSDFAGSKSSVLPTVNLGADFFLNKDIQSFVIRLELSFTENKTSLDGKGGTFNSYTSNLSFNQVLATLNPQLLYNFFNTPATKNIYCSRFGR